MRKILWILLLVGFSAAGQETLPDCSRKTGSIPSRFQTRQVIPVENVVIIMQENHSFDSYFGRLNSDGYEGQVDGVTPDMSNVDRNGNPVQVFHQRSACTADPGHTWGAQHAAWNHGKNDHFVLQNGRVSMGYYERTELPYYYELANLFAIGDRFFSSAMGPTFPNRFFLYAGTAFGHTKNDIPRTSEQYRQRTIFDVLDEHHISWKYYTDDVGYLYMFGPMHARDQKKMRPLAEYESDLRRGRLPQVSLLESLEDQEDEHPPVSVQIGQAWVAGKIRALMESSYWKKSALFLVYDENGGFFDHVPPPRACAPESDHDSRFERYGFRVPFVVVSPFAKHHYVSHLTYDHTSILKFLETKFHLPALSRRDANANNLFDFFDFSQPVSELGESPLPDMSLSTETKCAAATEEEPALTSF